jgi:ADP-ribose pyrophosphatase
MYVSKFTYFLFENRKINIFLLVSGRGLLGRWGPNHAGDSVVTRWAKNKQKILEIILINRKDNGDLALPGGMVDPG